MSDVIVVPSAAVEALRRKAKKLVKERGIAHHAALDLVARAGGAFLDWHHLIEAAKPTEPTEDAYKSGLVVGIDEKYALPVKDDRLGEFLRDERIAYFVLAEFKRLRGERWSDDDAWVAEEVFYYRWRGAPLKTSDQAMAAVQKVFGTAPLFARLNGVIVWSLLFEEDDDD